MQINGLSEYKFKKIAAESLRNALRLHEDSIVLFKHGSYPSAFQLSVLSLEEFAKAKWVDHYYYATITNGGFPKKGEPGYDEYVKFEQDWLKLLYLHPEKQLALISRETLDYSPNFVSKVQERKLELQKQQAVYVGLERSKGKVDTTSRVSVPTKKIKKETARQMISLLNQEFIGVYKLIAKNDGYWGIWEMDDIINEDDHPSLFRWPYRSGLKSGKWNKVHRSKSS